MQMVADNKEDLQKTLQWSNTFRKHGLRMNLEKTEVMWIGEQEVDLRNGSIQNQIISIESPMF